MATHELDEQNINTLRLLSADMVEKAKSGHPGMPMGAAALAYVLWTKIMKHSPQHPEWINRDRFVLSAGHGSALLYSLLHLTGYDLPMEQLKQFRQWNSLTPGHPEFGLTPGVETSTGPLGQGISNAVGMAMAEQFLGKHFNRPDFPIIDHFTFGICGDGDLMEGVSSEAASIAGHLQLGKLVFFYDDNQVSIEGSTELAFTESVKKRFEAYGWQVLEIDGNDEEAIELALMIGMKETTKPTLIKAKTHIGYGSPKKQDTASAHGEPLGEEELKVVKKAFGFPEDQSFYIPEDVKHYYAQVADKGHTLEAAWQDVYKNYIQTYPELAFQLEEALAGRLPKGWQEKIISFSKDEKLATRQASGKILNAIHSAVPLLIGGSADLAPSTGTQLKGYCEFRPGHFDCPNFHFGVREHAMGAIVNGMALNGMIRPYGATFLVFSDYMRPSIRLAALMDSPSIFIFTHDSIGLGEDGPTHQPVEHLMALRAIPNLTVLRPAEANETAQAWKIILERKKPTALILTRQACPVLDADVYPVATGVEKGAYVLSDCQGTADLILMATGSEVSLALAAQKKLDEEGITSRVVSMPSWELFEEQDQAYKELVFPNAIQNRLAIEAGSPMGWYKYVGSNGSVIGIETFGASAPGPKVMEEYGFSVSNVIQSAKCLLNR